MKEVKFLNLIGQYESIKDEIDEAIRSVVSSASFIGGAKVSKFESDFSEFSGSEYCIGVGNGTDALEIAIESLDLPKNSEIIVPANSFVATSEAVTRSGHVVVFSDCNVDDFLIDPAGLKEKITNRTKAVIPVHLYGQCCDMDAVRLLADEFDLRVIEDAAQAHGAAFRGQPVGATSDVSTYSFYPGKNLGAYGDGGAIVTNNSELATRCRMIANHGRIQKYDHAFEGRNSRLDTIQASILTAKLKHLPMWIDNRQNCAKVYQRELANTAGLILPKWHDDRNHVFHLYVVRTERRDELREFLSSKNIQTGIHYPIALPDLDAYQYLDPDLTFENAQSLAPTLVSLPIGDHLGENDIVYVATRIREFFETSR